MKFSVIFCILICVATISTKISNAPCKYNSYKRNIFFENAFCHWHWLIFIAREYVNLTDYSESHLYESMCFNNIEKVSLIYHEECLKYVRLNRSNTIKNKHSEQRCTALMNNIYEQYVLFFLFVILLIYIRIFACFSDWNYVLLNAIYISRSWIMFLINKKIFKCIHSIDTVMVKQNFRYMNPQLPCG